MEVKQVRIDRYLTKEGTCPFEDWIAGLRDFRAKVLIYKRLARLEAGNYGDYKFFNPILELRIHYGPGYRIYCGKKENRWIILLCGGAKKTQRRDIQAAKKYWKDFIQRTTGTRAV